MPHRSPDWVVEATGLATSDHRGRAFDITEPDGAYRFFVGQDSLTLLATCLDGDPAAVAEAFERHRSLIARTAWRVKSRHCALNGGRFPFPKSDFPLSEFAR